MRKGYPSDISGEQFEKIHEDLEGVKRNYALRSMTYIIYSVLYYAF